MNARTSSLGSATFPRWNAALNKLLVGAYKLTGFLLLTTILIGIVTFVGIHTFYLVHRAWVVPKVISPTDPTVLDLQARVAEEGWQQQQLVIERRAVETQLDRTRLIAEAEQSFQQGLPSAMLTDVGSRRESLERLRAARAEQRRVNDELAKIGQTLQTGSRKQLEQDFDAKLITQQELLAGSYQLAQLAQARSSLMQRDAELSENIRMLSGEAGALEGAVKGQTKGASALSYEGLLLRREHARSQAEALGAAREVEALQASLTDFGQAISAYDALLGRLRSDPLLQASERQLHVAFVPYDGESSVHEGAALYGCRLVLVVCERVGRVKGYLAGEHVQSHPVYGKELRGQWLEVELEDPEWAKAKVLHTNRPPLFF